ncbi:peptide deformylase [Candidatus Sulfidibacterium hydrothermale]|uniref:peptide deformylase n=1 Tax=Candidatus Sulfidibacterium hydrothermale TaxID=2875962 RepID=UPI001F0B387B|nr:peptide deformylase [Candidatus Sulfidibacterium hydrothermale]UBM61510.1 peptide deformylase [Candidatus Sulfidibacterium hydrothermale]
MMLPITAYGHPVLKKKGEEIDKNYPELDKLIEDMFETMYESNGVGLAAPQINRSIRLFIVDASPFAEEYPEAQDFKKVFINAQLVREEGDEWEFEEGCLSVPGINEYVSRKPVIYLSYYDENFEFHEEEKFDGIKARIIQHEYDHTDGILFVDRLPAFKKLLLKRKLSDISVGKHGAKYKMIYPKKRVKK